MSKKSPEDKPVEIYFNSACPVCNTGINFQKKRLNKHVKNTQTINWNDIHINKDSLKRTDYATKKAFNFIRERLHVRDSSGNMQVGIDAFITLWRITPGDKLKYSIIKLPVIYSLAAVFYNVFAFILYRWNIYRRHW